MRGWWFTIGVVLFASLFAPIGVVEAPARRVAEWFETKPSSEAVGSSVAMFWDLVDGQPKEATWRIVNAILGLTVFIVPMAVGRGVVRGAVMLGAGFMGFLLTLALLGLDLTGTMFLFGLIAVGATLGACNLRRGARLPTFSRVTAAVGGGLAVVFLLIGLIANLVRTEERWTSIVGAVVVALYTIMPIVAGVLCLVAVRPLATADKLVKAATTLIYVYLCCRLGWAVAQAVMSQVADGRGGTTVAVAATNSLAVSCCFVSYVLLLGWGTAELSYAAWRATRAA